LSYERKSNPKTQLYTIYRRWPSGNCEVGFLLPN